MTPEIPFATTDGEAAARYEQHKGIDPFPSIDTALLNSADIVDYVVATGMLFPFKADPDKLKPASYEVDFLGDVQYWDSEKQEWMKRQIKRGERFVLKSNSIAFVQVEPYFRLPDYIAIRFNLRITHVYRGILLGTGPLVDPGFQGPLYIPLHNLTNNDYTLVGGEGLLWMEFTKLSRIPGAAVEATGADRQRHGKFVPFPMAKTTKPLDYYLHKAYPHGTIKSSIPGELVSAKEAAAQAKGSVDRLRTVGFLTIFALVLSVIFSLGSLFSNMLTLANRVEARLNDRLRALEAQVDRLEAQSSGAPIPRLPNKEELRSGGNPSAEPPHGPPDDRQFDTFNYNGT